MKPTLLVSAAALFNKEGLLLLAERPKSRKLAGLWELPGGKIEAYETPEVALCRELKEELGIVVKEADLTPFAFISHDLPDAHLLMPIFTLYEWEGIPKGCEEQRLQWVDEETLFTLPMPDPDLPLRSRLADLIRSGRRTI